MPELRPWAFSQRSGMPSASVSQLAGRLKGAAPVVVSARNESMLPPLGTLVRIVVERVVGPGHDLAGAGGRFVNHPLVDGVDRGGVAE